MLLPETVVTFPAKDRAPTLVTRAYLAEAVVTGEVVVSALDRMDNYVWSISPFPNCFDKARSKYPLSFSIPNSKEIPLVTALAGCDGERRSLEQVLICTSRAAQHDDGYTEFRFVFGDIEVRVISFERPPIFSTEFSPQDLPLLLKREDGNRPAIQLTVCETGGGSEFDWSGTRGNFKRALEDMDKLALVEEAVSFVEKRVSEWREKIGGTR